MVVVDLHMKWQEFKGKVVTIALVLEALHSYRIEERAFYWTDEMLEPVAKNSTLGDVVYDESGRQVEIVEKVYSVKYENGMIFAKKESQLSKTKPLQKNHTKGTSR